jgi:hypothetical protein
MSYFVELDEFYLNVCLFFFRKRSVRELLSVKVPPSGMKISGKKSISSFFDYGLFQRVKFSEFISAKIVSAKFISATIV